MIAIVIPCYNESEVIRSVIREIRIVCDHQIIIIDDGSRDNTLENIQQEEVLFLRHKINRGKGAAIKTGVAAANLLEADVVVTMDGDGQHDPKDIENLVTPILNGEVDVVLGSRKLQSGEMPMMKVVANTIGNFFTWLFYGIWVSDSQSGFRAYSKYAALIIDTKADKYEYDSKIIREIKSNRLDFCEIPIHTRYTEYSKNKKQKQGFTNGLVTLFRMIWNMIV